MITFGGDAAKRKGAGVKFGKDRVKVDTLAELEGEERERAEAYRARQAQEQKRYANATDSEFWLAFCFWTIDDLEAFSAEFSVGALHARLLGADVAEALDAYKPESRKRGFGGGNSKQSPLMAAKTPDPLAGIDYTGDLSTDCFAEFRALHSALVDARQPEQMRDVTDSETWFVVVFENREHKTTFLEDFNLTSLGDKYIDGLKLSKKLRG